MLSESIAVFARMAGKMARWEVEAPGWQEAIQTVRDAAKPVGPVLALIFGGKHKTEPPKEAA